jgi:hypothetical protein
MTKNIIAKHNSTGNRYFHVCHIDALKIVFVAFSLFIKIPLLLQSSLDRNQYECLKT